MNHALVTQAACQNSCLSLIWLSSSCGLVFVQSILLTADLIDCLEPCPALSLCSKPAGEGWVVLSTQRGVLIWHATFPFHWGSSCTSVRVIDAYVCTFVRVFAWPCAHAEAEKEHLVSFSSVHCLTLFSCLCFGPSLSGQLRLLENSMLDKLALNSQRHSNLWLLCVGTKSMHHHTWQR